MFPWLRLCAVGLGLIDKSKADLLATTRVRLRVWPNDLDFNLHVNNGRYLTLANIGGAHWFVRNERVLGVVAVRAVAKAQSGSIDPQVLIDELGHSAPSPELPEWVRCFDQSAELLGELLRNEERSKVIDQHSMSALGQKRICAAH